MKKLPSSQELLSKGIFTNSYLLKGKGMNRSINAGFANEKIMVDYGDMVFS